MTTEEISTFREAVLEAQKYFVDSERFKAVVNTAIHVFHIDEGNIAHSIGVSRTTVKRWANGNAVPYDLARKPVYRFLLRQIDTLLSNTQM
jgi:DNA-binding transcriptional regulator YiaG